MKTLYLQDNMEEARFMSLYFARTPHSLHHVLDIEEANEVLRQNEDFDLLLIDVTVRHAREGSGLIQDLRIWGFRQTIVAVTCGESLQNRDLYLRSGADYVLQKPFRMVTLASLLQNIDPKNC